MTRTGKIARLPRTLRDQLNQRLHDGEKGRALIAWLNALPEVQSILTAEFDGSPINGQNLTEWKRGGYRDWVAHQEALCIAERLGEDAAQLQAQGNPPFTETLAIWLAARYSVAARQLSQCQGQEGWRLLREFCADVVRLRRGDHSAQRLRLEREQLELHRQRQHAKTKSEETPLPPEVLSGEATAAEQRDLVRQEASMPTAAQALASSTQQAPASPPATTIKVNQTKSNQIKPDQTQPPAPEPMNRVGDDVRSLTLCCPLFSLSPIGGEGWGEGALAFLAPIRVKDLRFSLPMVLPRHTVPPSDGPISAFRFQASAFSLMPAPPAKEIKLNQTRSNQMRPSRLSQIGLYRRPKGQAIASCGRYSFMRGSTAEDT